MKRDRFNTNIVREKSRIKQKDKWLDEEECSSDEESTQLDDTVYGCIAERHDA